MDIKRNFSPIGAIRSIPGFDDLIDKMKSTWDGVVDKTDDLSWKIATNFLTNCLDSLVVYLVEHNISGQDKKATVLEAVSNIYDHVTANLLPWYLKPFARLIKRFVINQIVDSSIDWIVERYNNGTWAPQSTTRIFDAWK